MYSDKSIILYHPTIDDIVRVGYKATIHKLGEPGRKYTSMVIDIKYDDKGNIEQFETNHAIYKALYD